MDIPNEQMRFSQKLRRKHAGRVGGCGQPYESDNIIPPSIAPRCMTYFDTMSALSSYDSSCWT